MFIQLEEARGKLKLTGTLCIYIFAIDLFNYPLELDFNKSMCEIIIIFQFIHYIHLPLFAPPHCPSSHPLTQQTHEEMAEEVCSRPVSFRFTVAQLSNATPPVCAASQQGNNIWWI